MVHLEGKIAVKKKWPVEWGEEAPWCGKGGCGCETKLVVIVGLWEKVTFEQGQGGERVSPLGIGGRAVQAHLAQRPRGTLPGLCNFYPQFG